MGDSSKTNRAAAASTTIEELVERFRRNIDAYRAGKYNETLVRREFIDPMFAALGWDIDNRAGYAEAYKDVIHEDAIKVGGATKAPDYCFRVGGTRKFFVEAKKPSVDLARDISPAYQLRRYGWSAKLPVSILTDFEEFAVYDCRIRPKQGDKASTARTMYFTFESYVEQWDNIASVFSKEAVLQGSFDKYVIGRKKRGTAEVDAEFLKEIEKWRKALAGNIARQNKGLGVREINFAVQRTIDRIIFLRMCEDRGAEPYGGLQGLINGIDVYGRLMQMFRSADDRYNSGLFYFNDEPGREQAPDTLTPDLKIGDKVLKDIFRGLYYPTSPYEFSVLPADILGNVYEQFLGSVIHLTKTKQARVEEKPEVKKAGGVYYTPKYIVSYIVEHTVGKLIEGKTPKQIARLKILDPACGSGSFLVGTYKYLLDKHRDWYLEDGPEKHTKELYRGAGGQWYLTTAAKKRILLNNIYGVDIDSQAVEVTKLNLLLCVMENENQNTIGQMALIHQRILPDLSDNIKCGNSLIGSDFYEGQQLDLFDTEAQYRINAFDWETEFPKIFKGKKPGFDAVIGNPPYIRVHNLPYEVTDYLKGHYVSAYRRTDISVCFLEGAHNILRKKGILGFITSVQFFSAEYGERIRNFLAMTGLETVVDFSGARVFQGATTYPGILIVRKDAPGYLSAYTDLVVEREPSSLDDVLAIAKRTSVSAESLRDCTWSFTSVRFRSVLDKMRSRGIQLQRIGDSHTGLFTGLNKVLLLDAEQVEALSIESQLLRPIVMGKDPVRYGTPTPSRYVIYPYIERGTKTVLLPESTLASKYPICYEYLKSHRRELEQRKDSRRKLTDSRPWYALTRFSTLAIINSPKILTPGEVRQNKFCLDTAGSAFYCARVFAISTTEIDLKYLLGILNSKAMNVWLHSHCPLKQGGYYSYNANILKRTPIPQIDFADATDKSRHDGMVELVERMLGLQKALAKAKTDHDKTLLQRRITSTDRRIDQLVYELYGLTEEEISIVEGEG